jgi:hypothetical protein
VVISQFIYQLHSNWSAAFLHCMLPHRSAGDAREHKELLAGSLCLRGTAAEFLETSLLFLLELRL